MNNHQFSRYATPAAKDALKGLLDNTENPEKYRQYMLILGSLLSKVILADIPKTSTSLVVTTAEDADFLHTGVLSELDKAHLTNKIAVFWNNHYQLPSGDSVAPIVHSYLDPDFDTANNIIIVKSIVSGSCVVRTNLIEALDKVKNISKIFILSPVMHKDAEQKLKAAFPKEISDRFNFIYFVINDIRTEEGEIIPGIGGNVYKLLGLAD
ncbi:hypothetical protein [Pelistega suis]|uniref:hypothetical protein n=1 Tax=Pelistega suis TaxID=1631957 RepID=UPI00211BCD0C|nr:hypothetical protein [Pelistega suis]MCQ9328047.1 hypothetical protein [Pelistega suis]